MSETLETLAGTMPDGHVAERLGIDVDAVKAWRREQGVPAFRQGPPSARAGAPAGDATPARGRRIVRRRGDTTSVVAHEPAAEPPTLQLPEAPRRGRRGAGDVLGRFRDRLGKVSDDEIATEAGVTRGVVGAYRRKHGIPAYEGYLFKAGHAPAGERPAKSSTPRASRSSAPRRARSAGGSRIDAFADLVGVESDADVAAKAGVSRTAVTAWRRRKGIGASQPRGEKRTQVPSARAGRASPLAAFVDQLGTVADSEIAKQAGVSPWVVGAYRRKQGIAGWQGFRQQPREAATAQPVSPVEDRKVAPRALYAYVVVATAHGEQREFVTIGANIAEACAPIEAALAARQDGPWTVSQVRYHCDALG